MLFNKPNKTGGIQTATSKERSNKETKKNQTTNCCFIKVVDGIIFWWELVYLPNRIYE